MQTRHRRLEGGHAAVPAPHFTNPPRRGRFALWLTHCVDGGLTAAIVLVPMTMGGRHPLGQLALVAIAVFTAACWCIRQFVLSDDRWVHSSAIALWIGGVLLVGLQLIAMPWSILTLLSPQIAKVLPWMGAGAAGPWRSLTYCPASTTTCFTLLVAVGLLLIVAVQRLRRIESIEWLLRRIAIITVVIAMFGLVQSLTSNGKYFWLYDFPYDTVGLRVGGPFTNENHFAHFLVLGMGAVLWALLKSLGIADRGVSASGSTGAGNKSSGKRGPTTQRRRFSTGRDSGASTSHSRWKLGAISLDRAFGARLITGLWSIGLAVCFFAVLMSLSRGGAISMAVALLIGLTILWRGGLLSPRIAFIGAAAMLFVVGAVSIFGHDFIAQRMGTLADLEKASLGRRQLWQADLRAAADYPLTGAGLGTHAAVYPLYFEGGVQGVEFTHAENGYIQLAMETGLIGLALAVTALAACGYWCWAALCTASDARTRLCVAAIAPAFAASALHSATDFVWYVPGCMVIVALLGAAACRLYQMSCEQTWRRDDRHAYVEPAWCVRVSWPRCAAAFALLLVAATGVLTLPSMYAAARAEPAWERCIRLQHEYLAEDASARRRLLLRRMIEALEEVEAWQPHRVRLHTKLAACYQDLFAETQAEGENPFSLREIQDSVYASGYQTQAALFEWLWRALDTNTRSLVAAHYHAVRAIADCPLEGENHLCLADTCFLDDPLAPELRSVHIQRAYKVRPHAPTVLFWMGHDRLAAGHEAEAFRYWREAFSLSPTAAERILAVAAPVFPVDTLLAELEPPVERLRHMVRFYRKHHEDIAWGRTLYAAEGEASPDDDFRLLLRRSADASREVSQSCGGPERVGHLMAAAEAYHELGDRRRRWEMLSAAVDADPTHYPARRALGLCAMDVKRYHEAERHLRWCLRERPKDTRLRKLYDAACDQALLVVGADPIPLETGSAPPDKAASRWSADDASSRR